MVNNHSPANNHFPDQKGSSLEQTRKLFNSLTPKQRQVCELMIAGLMNKQIADRLGASINTVKTHRSEVFRRMGAHSLLELSRMVDAVRGGASPSAVAGQQNNDAHPGDDKAREEIRLLVVEDNDVLRQVMVSALSELGYLVTALANGEDLDAALAAGPVDVVLLDILLGEDREDGYALATRLRRRSRCGIIMTTALGEREARIRGLDEGADAYLVKPIDFDELDATIRSVLRRLRQAAV